MPTGNWLKHFECKMDNPFTISKDEAEKIGIGIVDLQEPMEFTFTLSDPKESAQPKAKANEPCVTPYHLPAIDKIRYQDRATTIFWKDGTKTTVKCGQGEAFDRYTGFMAAVCKKLFGSTTHAKKLRVRFDEDELKRIAREKREAAEREAQAKRAKREKEYVKKLARQKVLEMRAEELAKKMLAAKE